MWLLLFFLESARGGLLESALGTRSKDLKKKKLVRISSRIK